MARPDVVVLDLDLPDVHGQVLLRAMKREPDLRPIRMVVATGYPTILGAEDRMLAAAVLREPFEFDGLLSAGRGAN